MEMLTVRLPRDQIRWLDDQAMRLGRSRSAIVRDLIAEQLAKRGLVSSRERTKDLCGSLKGPKDHSTRKLKGYGGPSMRL